MVERKRSLSDSTQKVLRTATETALETLKEL